MIRKTSSGLKIICLNRKASFNYFFEDLLEAGIVLKGSEIKSIRDGKVKVELAVAKGKKQFDKRAVKKNRDWNRDKARYIRKSS